jgi:hypothetical protein
VDGFVFSVEYLRDTGALAREAAGLSITEEDVAYALDVILRYPLYGEVVGAGRYYLSHPLREEQQIPTMRTEPAPAPHVPIRIGPHVTQFTADLSLDDFGAFLHEARGAVRDLKLSSLPPGAGVERGVVRDLASRLWLPPRLRASGKAAAILAGIATGLGASPVLGSASALLGAALSVASALWSGRLPRPVARIKWLRWAVKWDIEEEAACRDET